MIDIKFVKDQYSKMTDSELETLARHDGENLRTEALTALYEEFLKRKLDTSAISALRIEKANEHIQLQQEADQIILKDFEKKVWSYCFSARVEGKTDHEIFDALINSGLQPEVSQHFVEHIDIHASAIIKEMENKRFAGGFVAVLACIITLFLFVNNLPAKAYFYSIAAIIVGTIGYFASDESIRKLKNVIRE
jgi:hypothetical protein